MTSKIKIRKVEMKHDLHFKSTDEDKIKKLLT